MIFDTELDYLADFAVERVPLASNSVPVQLNLAAQGAGPCVAHNFALPGHPRLRKLLEKRITLKRAFYLVRHQGDQRSERLNQFAEAISGGLRDEVARLKRLT